ncbi:MAG: hypothetical protein IIA67_01540, partial [Planctomycetes bacterium]|nr:hypothetical protein [Planctomycetota bacterium]
VEQIIFPEVNIDKLEYTQGMNITFVTTAKKSSAAARITAGLRLLRQLKHPVTEQSQGDLPHPQTAAERAELVRWIDALDRI